MLGDHRTPLYEYDGSYNFILDYHKPEKVERNDQESTDMAQTNDISYLRSDEPFLKVF